MERSKRRRFGSQSSRWRRIGQGCCIAWRTRSITCVLSFFFRRHVEGHQSQTDLYDLWIWHAFFGAPVICSHIYLIGLREFEAMKQERWRRQRQNSCVGRLFIAV
ncbi:hypothetical protein BRARA_B03125 [Brassica rapa]|uniref:Uncharacterized protein n=1 Tax=Brassica campestris TaxID=3711 RepID=A0A398ALK6_BRACM|nr:hypothetical protein BRARA_B03125 [Brassica rapa]